ncbi:MAG: hypothetical protein K0U72_11875 [Gammaproteobacteria bacterium]|nr:hypothetical protein [Gammaproteobacteria bacterium]
MSIFSKEAEMQDWLAKQLETCDGLGDLITNTESIDNLEPKTLEEQKVLSSYKACLSALYLTEVVSDNSNISLNKGDSLKPDFVLYSPESEGIVIVELKNIPGPTRQAGTELGAYAGEIRSIIPFLSEGDLFHVIVSPYWPALLRHFVFHEIFWHQKNLICLEPKRIDGDIRLAVKPVEEILEADTATRISADHIAGYQLCLYDNELYAGGSRDRLDEFMPQMRSALSVMAAEGNRQKGHGFAFLWRDLWEQSLAPYSISMFNFAPFQSIERFLHGVESLESLTGIQQRFIRLMRENDPSGHGQSFSRITKAGIRFLDNVCSPRMEGFMDWDQLAEIMQNRWDPIAFQGWGSFGDIYNERLIEEYSSGDTTVEMTCPLLGLQVVNELIDDDYEFIRLNYIDFDGQDNLECLDEVDEEFDAD